ncbi:hypothetical protein ROSINTL182_06862 [Roseburia intestinalis L1-82]|uniref:Uncharacterized protein n=1 Tax=Roseburia intestinalis L1-82 TaxID=536231 RepID=C7GAD2_9FIRM|nr:hypothetical protein ROSINTL182_06862 [Roseburia intestinalis L1-82]
MPGNIDPENLLQKKYRILTFFFFVIYSTFSFLSIYLYSFKTFRPDSLLRTYS